MAIPPTDQCSPSSLSLSAHFPSAEVDTWHALANEMKAEVMYLSSAGKRFISGIGKPGFGHALLCHVLQYFFFFFFLQIENLWKPCIKQVCGHRFPNSICLLCLSVSCFGNSCNITNLFILSYLLWWSVISDLWCYYYNCFGEPQTTPL